MNEVLRRRLVGLATLLVLAFLLSLLLPGAPAREEVEPSTTVSLSGEVLQVTEADAVPPPDDYTAPASATTPEPPAAPAPEVAHADPGSVAHPAPKPVEPAPVAIKPPTPTPQTAATLKALQPASKPEPEAAKVPPPAAHESAPASPVVKPPVEKPPVAVAAAKPKPVEAPAATADKPKGPVWYVQIGSFADAGTATTIVSLIRRQGYHGEVTTVTSASAKVLNRVRAGPYATEVEARSVQARISTQGYPQARVVVEGSR